MSRHPSHPIHPQFVDRWSPRAYTGEALPEAQLLTMLEAARWSPSASNTQPWRFVYALSGQAGFDTLLRSLVPFNQDWAHRASALVVVVSATTSVAPGSTEAKPSPMHAFDTGAAWMALALQAQHLGWSAHAMGGFNREAVQSALACPASMAVQCVVAVGRPGAVDALPEALREREHPNQRRPLAELATAWSAEGMPAWWG